MRDFKELISMDMIDTFIKNNELAMLYISKQHCSVCHRLLLQIQNMIDHYPKIKFAQVNVVYVPEFAGHYSIFTFPVLLIFLNGKEYIREARIVHLQLLDEKIKKLYDNVTQ